MGIALIKKPTYSHIMAVNRFDRADFKKAVRLDNGWVRAPAKLTRTGVFSYRQADGSIVKEFRPPEEVFAEEAVRSFDLVPLTDDHPYNHKGRVTSANAKQLTVGTVGNLRQDGDYLAAEVNITDAEAVAKVMGGRVQLSCGYTCDREKAPAGAGYDYIQRNIRGNHVAIVAVGRAGPEARIHLDAEDAECVDDLPITEETPVEIKTDEAPATPVAVEAAPVEVAPTVDLKVELDKAVARADAADKEIERLNAELAKANDPARIQAAVASRAALEAKVREVCPDLKCDGLTDTEVMKAAVKALDSEITLDGKSSDAVEAYFDSVLKYARKRNALTETTAKTIAANKTTLDSNEDSARSKFYNAVYGAKR